jgi:hypothetical protein
MGMGKVLLVLFIFFSTGGFLLIKSIKTVCDHDIMNVSVCRHMVKVNLHNN